MSMQEAILTYLDRSAYFFQHKNCPIHIVFIALWQCLFGNIKLHQQFILIGTRTESIDFEDLW